MTATAGERAGEVDVVVNGEPRRVHARTLTALIEDLGYGGQKVATALNGDFVPARARDTTPIAAGDQIEIVSPRQGG
ncbi:MAG: sulfur carrier protein ThiS [Hyphomicrobiaceae bacterium]